MKRSTLRSLSLLALASSALAAHAGTYTLNGSTLGGPTFNRPVADNPPTSLSNVGTNVAYSAFTFSVTASGNYDFVFGAVAPPDPDFDIYGFLYQGSFDPTSPLSNVLIGDDDAGPGLRGAAFSYGLTSGTTYVLVTTGFENDDAGVFQDTITGPGNVNASAVPGPAAAASFALMALRRRKRA